MALRYDDIKKGRRWDWDKLQDPEERRRREQEKRDQDPEYKKTKSILKQIEERRKKELSDGREDWGHLKRKLRWRLGAVILVLVVLMGMQLMWIFDYRQSIEEKLLSSELIVSRREAYSDYGDPASAFISWRSAWVRNDMQAVIKTDSARRLRQQYGEGNVMTRLADRHRRGLTAELQRVAVAFGVPETIRMPDRPYQSGELAVFKSGRIVLKAPQIGPTQRESQITRDRWVAAFAWDGNLREWRLEDVRREQHWDESWRIIPQILTPAEYLKRKAEAAAKNRSSAETSSSTAIQNR